MVKLSYSQIAKCKPSIKKYCNTRLQICITHYNETINFVDNGKIGYLDKRYMSKGRKHKGDAHKLENLLLLKSGFIKIKNKWIKNNEFIFNYNNNQIKYLIINLEKIIFQRCMRHKLEGWKDIKDNNKNNLYNHRKAIQWFINGIKNIISFL